MRINEMPFAAMMIPLLLGVVLPGVASGQQPAPAPATPAEAPEAPQAPVEAAEASDRRVVSGDLTISEGETVGEVVVIGGDLEVYGEVTGDVSVFGGDLELGETGVILGNAVVTGGEFINEGGRIRGEMRAIDGSDLDVAAEIQRALGSVAAVNIDEDVRREIREDVRRSSRQEFGPSGPIGRGFGGLISTLALGLVLAGIGAALVFYGRPYLETVSDTVRGSAMRSGATGLAASFLVVPAFVVVIVALAVSIVGIPFLLVAIPLYPLAIFSAAVFGLLAVCHAIGERTAEQSRQPFDLRYRNSYAYLFTGLAMLLTPHFAAHLLEMTGFLSFIGTLLMVVTWAAIWVCATVGFGAVILSRAGTRRTFAPNPPETNFDDDLFDEPIRSQGHA